MKKIALLMAFCLILFSSVAYAKQYNDSWGDHGFSILRQNSSDLSLNFSVQVYLLPIQKLMVKLFKVFKFPVFSFLIMKAHQTFQV